MIVHFVTSNKKKFQEVKNILDINVEQLEMDIIEIQGSKHDIAKDKLKKACELNPSKFVMIDDTSIEILALNKFPGPYGKDFLLIGNECIENLVSKIGREAVASCIIGLGNLDEGIFEFFEGEVNGKIVQGDANGFGFDNLFLPDNSDIVYGKMSSDHKGQISHRGIACRKMQEYILKKYCGN